MRTKLCAALGYVVLMLVSVSARADDSMDARKFADSLGREAVSIMEEKKVSDKVKRERLEQLFEKNVDIEWIGQFVLGRYWRGATDEQKQRYMQSYKSFIINNYTGNFKEIGKVDFEISKVTPDERGGFIVTMQVKRANGQDTVIDYTVRKKNGAPKVYDIIVEGVSMITTQRSEFSSVVSQNGVDYLIAQLDKRIASSASE